MTAFALLLFVAAAGPAAAQQHEINYPAGSLGFTAILDGDYAAAELQLRNSNLSKYDPGRALNLGHVLAKTGRPDRAAKQFRRVLWAAPVELILADGRTISSHEAAEKALTALSASR